jgi:hypothetical protein
LNDGLDVITDEAAKIVSDIGNGREPSRRAYFMRKFAINPLIVHVEGKRASVADSRVQLRKK